MLKTGKIECEHHYQQMMTSTNAGAVVPSTYTKNKVLIDPEFGPYKAYTRVYCVKCTDVVEMVLFDKTQETDPINTPHRLEMVES